MHILQDGLIWDFGLETMLVTLGNFDFWGIQQTYWESKILNKYFMWLEWDCDMRVVNTSEKIKKN